MGSMKVTLSAAMRARDVSRPRAEQLAEAAAREDAVPRRIATPAGGQDADDDGPAPAPREPRSRRRRRRS